MENRKLNRMYMVMKQNYEQAMKENERLKEEKAFNELQEQTYYTPTREFYQEENDAVNQSFQYRIDPLEEQSYYSNFSNSFIE